MVKLKRISFLKTLTIFISYRNFEDLIHTDAALRRKYLVIDYSNVGFGSEDLFFHTTENNFQTQK